MLTDISGNTFSALGPTSTNVLPTVTYNPKQLYGNDLYVWIDMTDWRNMYNSSTGSTNIPSTGCIPATSATDPSNHTSVRRMEDMAGNFIGNTVGFTGNTFARKFYRFPGNISGNSSPSSDSLVTGATNLFNNNQIDTNKGYFSGTAASVMLVHNPELANSINWLAPNSAVTVCSYFPQTNTGFSTSLAGIGFDYSTIKWFGFFQSNSSTLSFGIPVPNFSTGQPSSTTITVATGGIFSALTLNTTIMLTSVICGRTADFYLNTTLLTSVTIPAAVIYPFSANVVSTFSQGGLQICAGDGNSSLRSHTTARSVWEAFIANSYTSPQQINLLYNYFRVKFKDRSGDLF